MSSNSNKGWLCFYFFYVKKPNMKFSRLLFVGLTLMFFTSCEKDSEGASTGNGTGATTTIPVTSIVVSNVDTSYTLTPTYDSQCRVTMIPNVLGSETYFAYSGTKKIVSDGWNSHVDTLSIGSNGYPAVISDNDGDKEYLTYDSNLNITEC
jgi:hypothetical protein